MKLIVAAVLMAYLNCGVLNALKCGDAPLQVQPNPVATNRTTKKHTGRRSGQAKRSTGAIGCAMAPPLPARNGEGPIPAELFWVSPIPPVLAQQAPK
jgi:hypothetical protein